MNIRVQQRPTMCRPPRKAAFWLALTLLFFVQLASASHHHDDYSVKTHDCAVCSQLQTVKHTAISAFEFTPLRFIQAFVSISPQTIAIAGSTLLPPARAPPISYL